MGDHSYASARRSLLRAAAWNGYVARRGLNGEAGRRAQKANQVAMVQLRASRPRTVLDG